jgi:hypothetical protein
MFSHVKKSFKVIFWPFTLNMNITRLIFNNKDEVIQVVNSKPKSLKICDNTNNIEFFCNPNLWTYYVEYLTSKKKNMCGNYIACVTQ